MWRVQMWQPANPPAGSTQDGLVTSVAWSGGSSRGYQQEAAAAGEP